MPIESWDFGQPKPKPSPKSTGLKVSIFSLIGAGVGEERERERNTEEEVLIQYVLHKMKDLKQIFKDMKTFNLVLEIIIKMKLCFSSILIPDLHGAVSCTSLANSLSGSRGPPPTALPRWPSPPTSR